MKALSAFFGGGSSYMFLILAGALFIFWQWGQAGHKKAEERKAEIETLQTTIQDKDALIGAIAGRTEQRQARAEDQQKIEDGINAQPETRDCVNSPSVQFLLEQLRDREAGAKEDNSGVVLPMPREAESTERGRD